MKNLTLMLYVIAFTTISVAQWERTNGPEGMSIYSLANIDGITYAGSATDGVYASTDDGNTWYSLNSGIETERINAITSINDILLAGTSENGVYHSTDGGQTWLPASNYNVGVNITCMIVKDQYVFAGISDGLLRSSDNGITWEELNFFNFTTPRAMCVAGDKLIAGSSNNSYASTDNGETWSPIQSLTGAHVFSLYSEADTVIAGARNEIYRSIDQGNTFFPIEVPFDIDIVNMYSITSIDQTLFMATSYDGVYKSTDNGLNWSSTNDGMGPKDVRALAVTQSSNLIAGSHYSGVYRSVDNGENWNKSMTGFPAGSSILTLINSDAGVFAGTRDGVYKTTDNGTTWEKLTAENDTVNYGEVRGLCISNDEIYLALTYQFSGIIYKSPDLGKTWIRCENGFPPDITFMYSVVISGNNVLAGASGGVFYSTDNGDSWQPSNLTSGSVIEMAVTTDYVYAVLQSDGVYRSSDDGVTWTFSFTPPSIFFTGLTALDNSAYTCAFDLGIYFTTDQGNIWLPAGFPSGASGYTVEFIPAEPGMVLAGTNLEPNYIYASFNYSHNFVPYSEELGVHAIAEALTSNDSYSFAGTAYNGVWRRTLPGLTGVDNHDGPKKPDNFSLKQNYPNPFNPETTIEYSVPEGEMVTLKIYNLLGQEMKTLVNGYTSPGTYKIKFDASDLSSGIYYYRMEAGDFMQAHRMILMR